MSNQINQIEQPVIPDPGKEYSLYYFNQKDNVLRLFFNRLLATLRELLSVQNGGRYLYFPSAMLYSSVTQTLSAVDTPTAVNFEVEYFANEVSVASSSNVTVVRSGKYNFKFTAQFDKATASAATVYVWMRLNGVDIDDSAHKYYVAGSNAHVIAAYPFTLDMNESDYVEIMWSADSTDVQLISESATANHPGMASAALSVTFVSNT